MMVMNQLPVSPYLDNATRWWIYVHVDLLRPITAAEYQDYCEWLSGQGVIIRQGSDSLKEYLLFNNESDLMVFAMKWGN